MTRCVHLNHDVCRRALYITNINCMFLTFTVFLAGDVVSFIYGGELITIRVKKKSLNMLKVVCWS